MNREGLILTWAVRAVSVLLVAALAYLGYLVATEKIAARTSSPAGRAAENLADLVKKKPNDAGLRLKLAESLLAANRVNEASEQYQAALKIQPDNATAMAGLAKIAMDQDEWVKAEGYWNKIVGILSEGDFAAQDQRYEQAYFYLGVTMLEQEKYEEAVGYLKRSVGLRRDASDTHYLLSYAYGKLEAPEKQREHLEAALLFDPMLPEANYDLGTMLLADGDPAGAAEHFRKSADKAPDSRTDPADALAKLGPFEKRMASASSLAEKDAAAALVEVRIAIALKPDDIPALKLAATLYEKTKDRTKARETWDSVLRLDPDDADAQAAVKRLEKVDK